MQSFSLHPRPLFERQAVGDRKAGQEVALIERGGLLQLLVTGLAGFLMVMGMRIASIECCIESRYVAPNGCLRITLQRLRGDEQRGLG